MAEDGGKAAAASAAAAEAGGGGAKEGGEERTVKLFVGQVPKHMAEADLLALFREVAAVDEVTVIKDKATKVSRGARICLAPRIWPRRPSPLPRRSLRRNAAP
jgi:CUG-BP- and ETR3-like factor